MARSILVVAVAVVAVLGCKSPKELGKEAAEKKLGFVEGIAEGVKEKGAAVGRKSVEGVAEVVKGVGSAAKDQLTPLVEVSLDPAIEAGSITVRQARAHLADADRGVVVEATFPKKFEGGLQLVVLTDAGEAGRSKPLGHMTILPGLEKSLAFRFAPEQHLSDATGYRLVALPPKTVAAHKSLKDVTLSQLQEEGGRISLYAQFAAKFSGALEARAFDATNTEIGRSDPTPVLTQEPDSAANQVFVFPAATPLAAVTRFEIARVSKPTAPAKPTRRGQ